MAIVLLHTVNGARVYHIDTVSVGESLAAYTVCAMLMWAVPCFLMVSGALLLDPNREITWGKIFGKYIRRMIVALVIFTAIFTVIRHDPNAGTSLISEFFTGLAFNHCMAYLWYLYLMIGLYLMMPFYKKVAEKADTRLLDLLILILIVSALLPVIHLISSSCPTGAVFKDVIPGSPLRKCAAKVKSTKTFKKLIKSEKTDRTFCADLSLL